MDDDDSSSSPLPGAPPPFKAGVGMPFWVSVDDRTRQYLWKPGKQTSCTSLIVAFSGLGQAEDGVPVFEWRGALRQYASHGASVLFLRDTHLQWYVTTRRYYCAVIRAAVRATLDAAGKDPDADFTKCDLAFLGNSAGGFGALFFKTHSFPSAAVLAISPQAFLDSETRASEGDDRWAPYINVLNKTLDDNGEKKSVNDAGSSSLLAIPQRQRRRAMAPSVVHYNIHHAL